MAVGDKKISGLNPAGTLDGSEPIAIVKDGETVATTTQDVANLAVIENLGTDDLTSNSNVRQFKVNGGLSTNRFEIANLSGTPFARFQGDGNNYFLDSSGAAYASFSQSNQHTNTAIHNVGNVGTASQYAFNVYSRAASSSGIASMKNSTSVTVFNFRQAGGSGTLGISNSIGDQKIFFNGSDGKITTDGEIQTLTAGKGLIVLDRSNGKDYRLYVDNGVIEVEEVV